MFCMILIFSDPRTVVVLLIRRLNIELLINSNLDVTDVSLVIHTLRYILPCNLFATGRKLMDAAPWTYFCIHSRVMFDLEVFFGVKTLCCAAVSFDQLIVVHLLFFAFMTSGIILFII